MNDSTVPLAAIALVGSILALVVTPLFGLLRANTRALEKLVVSSDKVAHATAKGADEAKERNGHLGDQNLRIVELITQQNTTLSGIQDTGWQNAKANNKTVDILSKSALIAAEDRDMLVGGPQVVNEQHVEHQHIEKIVKE